MGPPPQLYDGLPDGVEHTGYSSSTPSSTSSRSSVSAVVLATSSSMSSISASRSMPPSSSSSPSPSPSAVPSPSPSPSPSSVGDPGCDERADSSTSEPSSACGDAMNSVSRDWDEPNARRSSLRAVSTSSRSGPGMHTLYFSLRASTLYVGQNKTPKKKRRRTLSSSSASSSLRSSISCTKSRRKMRRPMGRPGTVRGVGYGWCACG